LAWEKLAGLGKPGDQGTLQDSENIKANEKLPYELDNGHRRPKKIRRIIKALEILRYLGLDAWALWGSSGLPGALCGFPGALLYSLGVLLGVLLGLPGFSCDFPEAALGSLGAFLGFRYLNLLNDF
jgi:hypothetical protein